MKMPPKREQKDNVVYAASRRKAPPFKPQRPSKAPRIASTESERSLPRKRVNAKAAARRKSIEEEDDDEMEERSQADSSDSDEDLDDDPLMARPAKAKTVKTTKSKPARAASPSFISSDDQRDAPQDVDPDPPPLPSQIDGTTTIPQPLLVRLLHKHFADKNTKIDKHAIQILQKYFEVFVREAIARAQLQKKEDAEKMGETSQPVDVDFLELADLEKVAAGMLLDF